MLSNKFFGVMNYNNKLKNKESKPAFGCQTTL